MRTWIGHDAGTRGNERKLSTSSIATLELPARPAIFVLGSQGSVDVVGVHLLVLFLPLLRRQAFLQLADNLGETVLRGRYVRRCFLWTAWQSS